MSKAMKSVLLSLALCLLFGLTGPLARAASQQDIQQLRSLSDSVVENALIFHNPAGTPYDANNSQAYQRDMQALMQQTQRLGLSNISEQAKQLSSAVADLQHLPQTPAASRTNIPGFAQWFPQVLEAHEQLLALLNQHYQQAPAGNSKQQAYHQLSGDLQRLSLHYQLTAFPYLTLPRWMLDDDELKALDASVEQRLSQLPVGAEHLDKLAARYNFVRRYLLNPGEGWAPNAVQRYLASTSLELDKAAARLTP